MSQMPLVGRPDLSVVVPVYNEAESLPALAGEIRQSLEAAGLAFEVWLVDDGSDDDSWERHRADTPARTPRFAGVRFRRNYGKSAALAVGFERAEGRCVATLDADLQDDPAELPEMVAATGGRRRPGERVEAPKRNDPWEKRHPVEVLQQA